MLSIQRLSTIALTLAAVACSAASTEESEGTASALGDYPTVEVQPSVVGDKAIALSVKNASGDRKVSCKSIAFHAPIAKLDHCGEVPLSNEAIEVGPLTLAAGEQKIWAGTAAANAGGLLGQKQLEDFAALRVKLGFEGEELVYCPMGATEKRIDCGYSCTQSGAEHAYDEEWSETLPTGGSRRYRCEATGEVTELKTKCAGGIDVNGSKRHPADDVTTILETCQPDGSFLATAECTAGWQQTANRLGCEPAACGSVAHNGEYLLDNIDHGRIVTTCLYGQPAPGRHVVCDPNWLDGGALNCVERQCSGGHPNGTEWKDTTCGGGSRLTITYQCINYVPVPVHRESHAGRCQ